MTLFEREKYAEALKAFANNDINYIKDMVIDECKRQRIPEDLKKQIFNKFNIKENENNSNQLQRQEVANGGRSSSGRTRFYDRGAETCICKGRFREPKVLINT